MKRAIVGLTPVAQDRTAPGGPRRDAAGGRPLTDYDGNGRFTAAAATETLRRRGRATASYRCATTG